MCVCVRVCEHSLKMITPGFIYYFLWCLLFIFSVFLTLIVRISKFSLKSDCVENRYDYIIVGGGSAGSIIAARLSENANVSILLIEAGGIGFEMLNIPALGPLKQLSELDWQYTTVPQRNSCLGLISNVSKWPSGKILGGSTHLNYMIYNEGHNKDYFTWKDPLSEHWSVEDISYYFYKAKECFYIKKECCYNKNDCSTYVRHPIYTTNVSNAFLKAAQELGYAFNDFFFNENTGFSKPHLNLNEYGRRWTSDQFLRSKRKNLKIITNSVVEQIVMLNGFEAVAVKYEKYGIKYIVHANIEIVLCAGAIGSPKLLMLSGIGPKNVLDKSNVFMINDLPVGQNLQDHITTGLDLVFLNTSHLSLKDFITPWSFFEYFFRGGGPLASGLVDAIGIIHSSRVKAVRDSPDLEFMVMMAGVTFDKGIFFKNSLGISQKTWDDYFKLFTNEPSISILPVLLHPKSIGEITLDSFNPKGNPKIDPKYLSQEDDTKTLIEGIRIVQRFVNTNAMKHLGAKFNNIKFPKCKIWKFDSDDYWRCYIKHLTFTVYHPVGTCKMGILLEGGVVDHKLRVHRTNKLRVIDASIMPTLPSANINAAVIMIAEKGADLIKEDAYNRFSKCKLLEIFIKSKSCF